MLRIRRGSHVEHRHGLHAISSCLLCHIGPRGRGDGASLGGSGFGTFDARSTTHGSTSKKASLTLSTTLCRNLGGYFHRGLAIGPFGVGLSMLDHVIEATEHPCASFDDTLERFLTGVFSKGRERVRGKK